MAYATKTHMIERFREREIVQLTDRNDPRTGAIVDSVLAIALGDAQSEIDEALRSAGYVVPLSVISTRIVQMTCDIARYRLYQDMPARDTKSEIRLRYEDIRRVLDKIATGDITVEGAVPASDTSSGGMAVGDRTLKFGSTFDTQFGGLLTGGS